MSKEDEDKIALPHKTEPGVTVYVDPAMPKGEIAAYADEELAKKMHPKAYRKVEIDGRTYVVSEPEFVGTIPPWQTIEIENKDKTKDD